MGADDRPAEELNMGSGTSWVAGGLLVALAVTMFAVNTKDPLGFKSAS